LEPSPPTLKQHRGRKRKCLHCKGYFMPDPRNRHHQKYCLKDVCREVSKKASQRLWLASSKGADYFSGAYNVARVQKWRKEHPGYWKKAVGRQTEPLQDFLTAQHTQKQEVTNIRDLLSCNVLQDISFLQPALFVGLIASLTGSTLQDDIAQVTRRFIDSGRDILCNAAKPSFP
jgi:hypothetical protein